MAAKSPADSFLPLYHHHHQLDAVNKDDGQNTHSPSAGDHLRNSSGRICHILILSGLGIMLVSGLVLTQPLWAPSGEEIALGDNVQAVREGRHMESGWKRKDEGTMMESSSASIERMDAEMPRVVHRGKELRSLVRKAGRTEVVSGEGDVMFRVLNPGTGTAKPTQGSLVSVRYRGTFPNGEEFDSNLDNKDPFTFHLFSDQVIEGFDIAVSSMTTGEDAEFVLKPEFAYGDRGVPGSIPPDSTLVFRITLLGFVDLFK